ncbi:MAG: hypothetical protein HYT82_02335 [Candidatus Harrisonbacteria bacterium]|nr:hypothetical protein [Candidatus Harrisonbacteria bacterium]
MESFRKMVFSLVSLILVGAAAYYILKQDYIFNIIIPKGPIGDQVRAAITPVRQTIVHTVDNIVAKVKGLGQTIISDATSVVKQKAFDSVKDAVNEKLSDIGKDLGVPKPEAAPPGGAIVINTVKPEPASGDMPLGFSVKRGQATIFVLKNVAGANAKVPYAIAWGDEQTETGMLNDKDTKTLSHAWSAVGEYKIEITMTSGETTRVYSVYIIVYP